MKSINNLITFLKQLRNNPEKYGLTEADIETIDTTLYEYYQQEKDSRDVGKDIDVTTKVIQLIEAILEIFTNSS